MTDNPEFSQERIANEVDSAMSDLPIIERLEFVANLLLHRIGDPSQNEIGDPVLAIGHKVLWRVINVLRIHPETHHLN